MIKTNNMDKAEVKILYTFELYRNGKLVGYENHGIDPNLTPLIGVYHNQLNSQFILGNPITMGDKMFIFHDDKKLITCQ